MESKIFDFQSFRFPVEKRRENHQRHTEWRQDPGELVRSGRTERPLSQEKQRVNEEYLNRNQSNEKIESRLAHVIARLKFAESVERRRRQTQRQRHQEEQQLKTKHKDLFRLDKSNFVGSNLNCADVELHIIRNPLIADQSSPEEDEAETSFCQVSNVPRTLMKQSETSVRQFSSRQRTFEPRK